MAQFYCITALLEQSCSLFANSRTLGQQRANYRYSQQLQVYCFKFIVVDLQLVNDCALLTMSLCLKLSVFVPTVIFRYLWIYFGIFCLWVCTRDQYIRFSWPLVMNNFRHLKVFDMLQCLSLGVSFLVLVNFKLFQQPRGWLWIWCKKMTSNYVFF